MRVVARGTIVVTAFLLLACSDDLPRLEPCTGDYAFAQIQEWFAGPAKELLNVPGVHTLDANERLNCLIVGISDGGVRADVRDEASELGIPEDAIGFEISEPPTLATRGEDRVSSSEARLASHGGAVTVSSQIPDSPVTM